MTPESDLHRFLWFVTANWESIAGLVGLLWALIKTTKWGKSRQAAVDKYAAIVEQYGSKDLKNLITAMRLQSTPEISKVIEESARKADPGKSDPAVPLGVQVLNALPFTGPTTAQKVVIESPGVAPDVSGMRE